VGLFEQTLAAYQGDQMVYATLVSSGLPQWTTVQGIFRIHSKFTLGPMVGQEGKPDFYALESVPWSMYFFRDYALHGAYWHDDFGWRHSHGCLNLAPLDAKWLFEWTTPAVPLGGKLAVARPDQGTWVWVHD
jgi:lipoprotein-anchoring transpeptidase ErfK/SrfK